MGKPNPRKLERKRVKAHQRAKLKRRTEQTRPQAYHGAKYKTAEYVEPLFRTEEAIYRAFLSSDREICDRDVRTALEGLIGDLRHGHIQATAGSSNDMVSYMIRSFWDDLPDCPTADELAGILRTILGSIEVWTTPSANSRGYLSYLEGFMRKAGVGWPDAFPEAQVNEPFDSALLEMGRTWCAGEPGAGEVFRALAEQMIADGQTEKVAETCQQLIGEGTSTEIFRQLSMLAIAAQQGALRRVS